MSRDSALLLYICPQRGLIRIMNKRETIKAIIAYGMLIGMAATNLAFFVNQIQWGYVLTLKERPWIVWLEMAGMVGIICYGIWLLFSAFNRLDKQNRP